MTQEAQKTKFKICLVSISLAKGGAERSVAMQTEMLSSLGHDVHLVVLTNEIDFEYNATLFNLGIHKSKKDSFLSRILRFKKLRKYLMTQKFDVIIDHRPKNKAPRETYYHNYLYKNLKTIYVIHSSNKDEYLTTQPHKMAAIYNKCLATVCVSDYIKNHVAVGSGILNSYTIHNTYNPLWKQQKPQEKPIKDMYILSYGRLYDEIKDITFLLHAYTASAIWKNGIQLVIMGDGPDKDRLQKLAYTLPSANYIKFMSYNSTPFPIIENARCVTLTSKYEGFPMVLVESLSLGTPVVSLDITSGPSEIIRDQHNGLLISNRNEEEFGAALHSICNDEVLYLKLKKNTISSVQQFSMEKISEEWNQLLVDVIR